MTIIHNKPTYTSHISEEALEEIIQYYFLHKCKRDIDIQSVTRKERSRTEGFGQMERSYTKNDGLEIKYEEGGVKL